MLIQTIELLLLVIFASVMQFNWKIPSPIVIMSVVLIYLGFNIELFHINSSDFDTLVLVTLPILIAADSLKLKIKDVKQNGISLFWVAVVSVLLSVAVGIYLNEHILLEYNLSIAAVVILFCMVSATDPITVSAIFSNFKVPHKLKVLTEGESLFNDATALIVFSIAVISLTNPNDINFTFIASKSFSVVAGAIGVGFIVGKITTHALKLSEDALVEATILITGAYIAYWGAEHFHFSGILSIIVAILIANDTILKIIDSDSKNIVIAEKQNNFNLLKHSITNSDNHKTIIKNIDFISMFASAMLFASIASIVNFNKLWEYRNEILLIFAVSTVIRGLMMLKFAFVSNKVKKMQNIKFHWWLVLTFAGSKGALSVLMVHMIPNSFEYKELFENIIVGNIILSTFVYAIILSIVFKIFSNKFTHEYENEH